MNRKPSYTCIACSVFKDELEAIRSEVEPRLSIRYLDSMLHGRPVELQRVMGESLEDELKNGGRVLLVYGQCHPFIHEQQSLPGVKRIQCLNCCDAILGRERYRTLRKEGVFFIMPEWTTRWPEMRDAQLGMNRETARDFMADMHTRLMYVDTGVIPVPMESLDEASDYTGLSFEISAVGTGGLLALIREAMARLDQE